MEEDQCDTCGVDVPEDVGVRDFARGEVSCDDCWKVAVDAEFTEQIKEALKLVRDAGFAVAAFSPTQLAVNDGWSVEDIEDTMREAAEEQLENG
jgi:hypothetical protein